MNRTFILSAMVLAMSMSALADEATTNAPQKYKLTPLQQERIKEIKKKLAGKTPAEIQYMRTGGMLAKPSTGKGKIVVLNAQKVWPKESVEAYFKELSLFFHARIEVLDSPEIDYKDLAAEKQKTGAVAALQLVDQGEASPRSLVSYEDSWGIANLGAFAKAKGPILDGRAKRLVFRTFALTCGIGDPKSIGSTMWPAKDDVAFDGLYLPDRPFPNLMDPILGHLEKLGLEMMQVRNYRQACQEGWAPAPVDDVQKAIWDKVHNPPTRPLKITYDKAAQKPVVK